MSPHASRRIAMAIVRACLLALAVLLAARADAAGVSVLQVPADADGPALQGLVWTPCRVPNAEVVLGSHVVPGVRDCPISTRQSPLVVVSHGYGGSSLGHHDTAEALADAGFIVAAIDHSGDNYRLRGGPGDHVSALATRTVDIRRLIDYMLRQWPSREHLAAGQVGFFGFSRGGYTGLVLAGARPDFARLAPPPGSPCATAPEGPACAPMRHDFQALLAAPLAHDPRIKAAVIADPLSAVFAADGLAAVDIPIQLWASERGGDGVAPADVDNVRRGLKTPPDWHVARNAAHFAFLAPCAPAQLAALPEICRDAAGFDRAAFHAAFDGQVLDFFRRRLGEPVPAD